jgi:hypothetical protein
MSTPYKDVDSNAIIADIRKVNDHYAKGRVTRDEYRLHGMFSDRKIKEKFGNFQNAVNAAIGNAKAKQEIVRHTPTETDEHVGDRWEISRNTGADIHTLEELVDFCNIDLSEWRVERWVCNKWAVGAKDSSKRIVVTPLFQVKATLVRREGMTAAKNEVESLKDEAGKAARIPTPIVRSSRKSGNLLEINLSDAHFGKMAWPRETLGTPYDTRIAQREFLSAVEHILDRARGYEFDEILFVLGNDLVHSDDTQGRTTKGTYVDCDTRYYKTFEVVRETVTKCIERFRTIAPVVVKMVQGNHDELSVWHLGDSLTALFSKYKDVTIDNEPAYRKYYQWGKCGFLFTHGDKGKRADFPLLFATERPDIFGSSKWREVHTGHLHQTKTEEFHGVRVRIVPSLSAADAWHSEMGFVGQQRVGEAYVFNKEAGLIAQFFHNADAV